eukprot:1697223-Rhodomonas_salina.1
MAPRRGHPPRGTRSATSLRACYALAGTHAAYAGRRAYKRCGGACRSQPRPTRSSPLSPYTNATARGEVTEGMV